MVHQIKFVSGHILPHEYLHKETINYYKSHETTCTCTWICPEILSLQSSTRVQVYENIMRLHLRALSATENEYFLSFLHLTNELHCLGKTKTKKKKKKRTKNIDELFL